MNKRIVRTGVVGRERARINTSIVCELNVVAVSYRQHRLPMSSVHICRFNSDLIYTLFHICGARDWKELNRSLDLVPYKYTLYSSFSNRHGFLVSNRSNYRRL